MSDPWKLWKVSTSNILGYTVYYADNFTEALPCIVYQVLMIKKANVVYTKYTRVMESDP